MEFINKCLKDFSRFLKIIQQILDNKKIVVISEKKIISIPISAKIQTFLASFLFVMMIWVSYSTGKYFSYESIIDEKDRVIWTTNVTNENLQYQVTDLHKNLKDLNNYFDNIRRFDQLTKDQESSSDDDIGQSIKDRQELSKTSASIESSSFSQASAKQVLYNIRDKVVERINSLESVIGITGLNLNTIATEDKELQEIIKDVEGQNSNKGGPYIPYSLDNNSIFNEDDFRNEVNYLMHLEKVIHSLPLSSPLKKYYVSSRYGKRIDPVRGTVAMHAGIDLVGKFRSKVFSTAPGIVTHARVMGAYGRMVEIDHGNGIKTRYGHLYKILVKKGDFVKRGQLVALEGSSGRSTGPHLHYEVRYNNKTVNPDKFLKAGKYVF